MRRFVGRIFLLIAVMAALTVGASAAEVVRDGIRYDTTSGTVLGPSNQANITSAKILSEVNGQKITKIADDAFSKCTSLKAVEIASGITDIGGHAFSGCSILGTVYFPKTVKNIGSFAFSGCKLLNSVILPSALTTIEEGTFSGCEKLTALYIPQTVTTIKDDAFTLAPPTLILHCATETGPANNADDQRQIHKALLDERPATPAGCVTAGEERLVVSCGTCNRTIIDQPRVIPPNGHNPGPEQPEVPANCVAAGTKAGSYCTVCGKPAVGLEVLPIDPDTHKTPEANHVDLPSTPATCTKPGSSGGKQCPDCFAVTTNPSETPASGHKYDGKKPAEAPRPVQEATCSLKGYKVLDYVCDVCGEVKECKTCTDNEGKEVTEAYENHLKDTNEHASLEVLDTIAHSWGEKDYAYKDEAVDKPTCSKTGKLTAVKVCTVCGEKEWDDNDTKEEEKTDHTPPADWKEEILVPGDCETPQKTKFPAYQCTVCKETVPERIEEGTAPGEHTWTEDKDRPEKTIKAATCISEGEMLTSGQICSICGKTLPQERKIIPKTAHNWGAPVKDPDPEKENKAPTCGEDGVEYVIVSCQNTDIGCNETEHRSIPIPATGKHDWSEWETKEPTLTQPGEKKRVCKVCEKVDTIVLPATGDPDGPEDPDEPEKPKSYQITVVQGAGGTASASRTTAQAGDRVTITFSPSSGYELDMIRIITADGKVLEPDSQNRFTMPAASVEIRVTFQRQNTGAAAGATAPGSGSNSNARRTTDVMPSQNATLAAPQTAASEQRFRDIPMGHWAAGEIEWANQMGYMNGTGGLFNPNWNITHQQMWMILARLTGSNPASMAEARHWAVQGGYADGSAPTAPVKRHQLVTALYRCARLSNRLNQNTTSLAGYNDSRTVPAVARDAFSWALANGIVSGSADKNLMPNGNITRAQFAVILYRYSQRT